MNTQMCLSTGDIMMLYKYKVLKYGYIASQGIGEQIYRWMNGYIDNKCYEWIGKWTNELLVY